MPEVVMVFRGGRGLDKERWGVDFRFGGNRAAAASGPTPKRFARHISEVPQQAPQLVSGDTPRHP